ncbi:hypothetical protein B0T26DRAFT_699016 [Lasiosphaeria miniovina]|uniref:Uncharacterized protein n=1 Tax=Lasiosphaeria miniovina TaxID=1954250 RepID=A0AA40EAV2_9PEZI|nr:uncharacterized protein B0T26DRAFT_699016 [Lasiosphaeria miniovina]KAK0728703.1 hypothetical protein B0T26DRAFT_699016 [Lasiosphaeria miniovina]
MANGPQAFYALWQESGVREKLFDLLSNDDICAVRLANSACCNLVTKRLFLRTHLTFTPNTFTRPSRIQALSRIGHHVEHLTFHFAHSEATFLPPLIHPRTGHELNFLYTPHTSMASVLSRPKYGNSEFGEILTQQYPPLFHAASNVPSFINAMQHLPNIRHLTIKTPGQDPRERYRRDIVDYALISLRISLERAPLTRLNKLSLSAVHPSAFLYLRHLPGLGASPAAARRWRQIRKLNISVESWDFYGPSPGLDQLKIIDDFIRNLAPTLEKLSFTWLGRKGPCPLALCEDPLFAPPRNTKKLFNEVTSPMSPLPPRPSRRPLVMPRLRAMSVRNATMNAPQIQRLVNSHKATVREFDFENVALIGSGSWDDALAPLADGGSSDSWSRRSLGGSENSFRPPTARSASGSGVASSQEDEQLPASSAAAAAASRELFDVDLEGMVFGGINDVEALEAGVEEWARGVTAAAASQDGGAIGTILEADEEKAEDDDGLASDIEAARQASHGFSTKLKKRRIRKKSRSHYSSKDELAEEDKDSRRSERHSSRSDRHDQPSERHRYHSRSRHKHSRSDDTSDRHHSRDGSTHSRRSHRHHRRHRSEEIPDMPDMPEVIGTDDEGHYRPRTPQPKPSITAPILNPDPLPILLQPAVYDPSAKTKAVLRTSTDSTSPPLPAAATATDNDGLSSVQRSIEADLLAEAEDAAARSTALRRAKEAVLTKLSREFCRRKAAGAHSKDSAAVTAGLSALNLGMNMNLNLNGGASMGCGATSSMGLRIREGLFGRSLANVAAMAPDHRSMDSQTALVPLMFSRS